MACKKKLLLLNNVNVLLIALIYRRKKCINQWRKGKMKVLNLFTERRTKGEFKILLKGLMLFDCGSCIIYCYCCCCISCSCFFAVGKYVQVLQIVLNCSMIVSMLIALWCDCGWLLNILVCFIYQFLQFDWSKTKNSEENARGDQKKSAGVQLFCENFFQHWLFLTTSFLCACL